MVALGESNHMVALHNSAMQFCKWRKQIGSAIAFRFLLALAPMNGKSMAHGTRRLYLSSVESFVLMMSRGKHNSDPVHCFLPPFSVYVSIHEGTRARTCENKKKAKITLNGSRFLHRGFPMNRPNFGPKSLTIPYVWTRRKLWIS